MKTITRKQTEQILGTMVASQDTHHIQATFEKKDGSIREMKAMVSSSRSNGKTGEGLNYNPFEKGLLPVQDQDEYNKHKNTLSDFIGADVDMLIAGKIISNRETEFVVGALDEETIKFLSAKRSYRNIPLDRLHSFTVADQSYSVVK